MPFTHFQPSFGGGEISPSLQARIDSPAYNTWLHTACNFYVHPQGGASNRPGTSFVGSGKFSTKACRVIPFILSEQESYVLEMGEEYIRIYTSAGRVLDDLGEIYELETPYAAEELSQVQYVQHNQMLFLTHPSHAPRRLIRNSYGRFTLETVPLRFGPFAVANTDETKKLRVIQTQETIETEGVRASVSFLPTVDSNCFVWGYFNGERFFYAHDYGLDIAFLVSEFNRVYGSSGFTAYNLGGVIKVESPQATGGDCNGKTFSLEYRNSFTAPPLYTVSQTLSGGSNAGEIIVEGGDQFLLESNFDLFEPGHVGGRFSITHLLDNPQVTGTVGYDGTSSQLKTSGDFQLELSGSWTGNIVLEKSLDMGVTWLTQDTFSRAQGDEDISIQDILEDNGGMYLLRLRGVNISGEATYKLTAQSFVQEGILVVDEFISARQVEVTVEQSFGKGDWSSKWAEGSFSDKNGYPSCVFFYQDRLGFAGTEAEPQSLWFSKTSDYTNFGHSRATLAQDDSVSIHLSGKQLNQIRAVVVASRLLVFTAGSEWSIACNGAFSTSNLEITQQGERGAGMVTPVVVGNHVLFVQARAGTLRDFYYDYTSTSFTGEDLTLCAKHLFFNQEIRELCYQQEPDHLIWCVLSNGQLATLTYLSEQEVCAWTHHQTQGFFRSICTIPHRGYDEVWLTVQRENGWNIEKMSRRLASKEPQEQLFLDAAISVKSEDAFNAVTGLDHLEGQEVCILADGSPIPSQTVHQGSITLTQAAKQVQVGLGYVSRLKTLPVAATLQRGSVAQRVVSVTLQFVDSVGGAVGTDLDNLEEIVWRRDELLNEPISLATGYYTLPIKSSHEQGASVWVEQSQPLPFTLLALKCRVA